jgi:uncharacterized protein
MTPTWSPRMAAFALLAALAAGAGCASTARPSFYTLSAGVPAAAATAPGPSVLVGRAALPEMVDRPQLVVRADANQVAILEQQRWAEPLREAIPRVVAENLSRLLATAEVSTRDEVIRDPTCRVSLDVRRFEARAGAAVDIETLWTVACAGAPRRVGQSRVRQPAAGGGYGALVVAHGRALDAVSRDIGRAVRETTSPSGNGPAGACGAP